VNTSAFTRGKCVGRTRTAVVAIKLRAYPQKFLPKNPLDGYALGGVGASGRVPFGLAAARLAAFSPTQSRPSWDG
jgi:hypothetical protein